ncbi:MAG: type II secretion system F family protein, partial [Candidatus Hydrogenedentota bacterium]
LFIIAVVLSRAGVFQWVSGAFTTFIWPVSVVTRKFALARFFRSFALLLGSGLHINRCIESAAAITANPFIEKDLLKALPVVREGGTLVDAFARARSLTPMSREMLRVGELSGELEKQMKKISEYHLKEATHAVQVATKVLSAMIVLGVGVLVGYIVISFYSKLYGGMLDELGV